jgi:hypothetical protein
MKLFEHKLAKTALSLFVLVTVIFITARNLNPNTQEMFTFHDETQAARIQEFTLNLKAGQLPPRIAPDFSYALGYPVFNYYAPFSYWITSGINLLGIDVVNSLKLSFLLAIIVSFLGILFLMKQYVSYLGSLLSAVVYTISPYIAVEIFVRGNLAELWFYSLLPWVLYLLKTNSQKRILLSALVLSFLFTSHNVLSLVAVGFVVLYSLFQEKKLLNLLTICLGLILSAYFLIPAIMELNLVYASDVATQTNYADHFLCLTQLWTGPWGFGGSAPGCVADGFSFMLGKANILLGIVGLFSVILVLRKKFNNSKEIIFILIATILSIFMVTNTSSFVWKITESISAIFQFPWRLLIFILFGVSFFSAFITEIIPKKLSLLVIIVLIAGISYTNFEYFYGQTITKGDYQTKYLSKEYMQNEVAYKVAEYLPRTADYHYWRVLETLPHSKVEEYPVAINGNQELEEIKNTNFMKEVKVRSKDFIAVLNIHYAPYWLITKNGELIKPTQFDPLGRPLIQVSNTQFDTIKIQYQQTQIEQLANYISLVSLLALTLYTVTQFKSLWKTTTTKKH